MKLRRLFPLLILLALVVAPFGRVAAAEAMATAHQPAAAMAGHCQDMPAADPDERSGKSTIDCLVACAAIATAEAFVLAGGSFAALPQDGFELRGFAGLHPEAEPPPPRLS